MPRYIAIARGYDNVKLREIGEEFEFDGELAWAELVEPEKEAPVKKAQPPKGKAKPEAESVI